MIRINLLPVRAARKREYVKQQLVLAVVLIVFEIVGLSIWYTAMNSRLSQKNLQIAQARVQIEQYEKAIGEVEKYKGLEDALAIKLKTIDDLIKGKTGPVRVLDQLSQLIPKQVWLTKWEEKGGIVFLDGEAVSNKNLAQFMAVLERPMDAQAFTGASGGAEPAAALPAPQTPPANPGIPAPTGTPAAGGIRPASELDKRFFSNIQLMESTLADEKIQGQSFVKFKIQMSVNYKI